jgi:phosphopantothenoylcysteine synthetase/decarboxylase
MKLATKKRILITAGPTWVAIDKARVISNIASGETGFILANEFKKSGAGVTLLLGPGYFFKSVSGIKIIRFKYFSELARILEQELKKQKFSAVIHAAAVADYQPKEINHGKISSRRRSWQINLVPTEKLINRLKICQTDLFTVGFKFEPDASKDKLIEEGKRLKKSANLDLVVANSNRNRGYQAYILNGQNRYGPFLNKKKMALYLSRLMENQL